MSRRVVPLLVAVATLGFGGRASAGTLIGPFAATTPVRAYAGIALLSVRDSAGRYWLATQQGDSGYDTR